MNADYVENIIRNIDKQSYKCILVDGAWGIGKSYMVKKALEDMKDRTCFISLFGMDDCQKIYHEALFQFAFRTSRGGKIASGVQNFAKAAGNFCAEVSNVSNALAQAISERELFAMTSEKFKKNRIIVIDDLERRKAGLDLEELFGVIEELKQSNYIKVILIANSNEIHGNERNTFDKYKEKIIDRIFEITEHSKSIKWFDLGIDGEFIGKFLIQHNVKNLRTLQKAQDFYNDVKQYCTEINNDQFLNEIRLICFSIVIEDTDKLYYRKQNEQKEETTGNSAGVWIRLENELDARLKKYLRGVKCRETFVSNILAYYTNQRILTIEDIQSGYQIYLKAGDTPDYFKSEDAIRMSLKDWKERLENTKNSRELTTLAGDIDGWFNILEEDNTDLIKLYRNLLKKLLVKESCDKPTEENPLNIYNANGFYNITKQIRREYSEVLDDTKQEVAHQCIEYLQKNIIGKVAYNYSYWLRKWYTEHDKVKTTIDEECELLFTVQAFPTGNITNERYSICYNIITILYLHDRVEFKIRYEKMKSEFDKMTVNRVKNILREIDEEYPLSTNN